MLKDLAVGHRRMLAPTSVLIVRNSDRSLGRDAAGRALVSRRSKGGRNVRRTIAVLAVACAAAALTAAPATARKVKHPAPTSTTLAAIAPEKLAPGLLAINDMPTGWAVNPSATLPAASATAGACGGPNAEMRAQTAGRQSYAAAAFLKDPLVGPGLTELVQVFPDVTHAKTILTTDETLITKCPTYKTIDDRTGKPVTITFGAVSFTPLGDQTLAFRETYGIDGGSTVTYDTVEIRSGRLVMTIAQSGLTIDSTLTAEYAKKALTKLGTINVR
jgi:hypothetical protein